MSNKPKKMPANKKAQAKPRKKAGKKATKANQPPDWATATRYDIYRD